MAEGDEWEEVAGGYRGGGVKLGNGQFSMGMISEGDHFTTSRNPCC